MAGRMRGRQVFMESLIGHGVEYIFGNPGTTESPILDALLDYPQLKYIVALHEGVALGAASYYAQASGKIALVNVHVAPGLGNALGMLYNAFKARSPVVVTNPNMNVAGLPWSRPAFAGSASQPATVFPTSGQLDSPSE